MTRKMEEEDKARVEAGEKGLLFRYKGIVPIPSLGLMDDNITVTEAGVSAEQENIFMNENSAEKKHQFNPKKCKYIRVGKNKKLNPSQTLEVDSWDVKFDKEDKLLETEGGKTTMEEVTEIKYLGFVVSSDASNVANISDKRNKSFSTIRSITNMIKGLKTYTVQNGLIYLNSLLRSSILYGGETYYNLTERQLRMIEIIEEDCLVKILNTGSKVQTSLLYLETGQLPARFQIDIMMLNFLKYILHQDKNSLMSRFFLAQCLHPTRGDWVSNVKKI